jgi:predicted permease
VVLVGMAALFGHNLFALRSVDLGFRNQNVVAFSLDLPRGLRGDIRTPVRNMASQLATLPGIQSVSYGFPGPFQMGTSSASIRVPGSERTAQEPVDVDVAHIAPRYFETIGTTLVMGREIEPADTTNPRKVAVVNEAFVRAFLPGERHPDARYLSFDDSKPEGGEPTYIVGVVADIRHAGIQQPAKPTVYTAIDQGQNSGAPLVLLRTQSDPMTLLRPIYKELSRLSGGAALGDFGTLRQQIDKSIFEQRLLAALGGFFGGLALALAGVGLYGVIAYGMARRRSEIGIRIALGARRAQVVWMVLRGSLALVALGLAIGLPAALLAGRTVQSLLFGIKPGDPTSLLLTGAILTVVGLLAAYLPARRAASVDPTQVLRAE